MEPARRLSDGRAELRGHALGIGKINRARAQGGDAHARRGRKAKTGCSRGGSDDNCGVDQVAGEESAQGTRQSVACRIRQRCQAVPNLNMAKPRLLGQGFVSGRIVRGAVGLRKAKTVFGQARPI